MILMTYKFDVVSVRNFTSVLRLNSKHLPHQIAEFIQHHCI